MYRSERQIPASQPVAALAAAVDPAAQSVLDYLRAHRVIQAPAQDAATQGVQGYLNTDHAAEERGLAPAQRGMYDYIRLHSREARQKLTWP